LPLLEPGKPLLGAGFAATSGVWGGSTRIVIPAHGAPIRIEQAATPDRVVSVGTLNFGRDPNEPAIPPTVVIYPYDGQVGVPTMFGGENPDPRAIHGSVGPAVGYVVTFAFYRGAVTQGTRSSIRVLSAEMGEVGGETVPCMFNSAENDPNLRWQPNILFLIPKRPLRPSRTYRVKVAATSPEGEDLSRDWTFTTASSPLPPRPSPAGFSSSRSRDSRGEVSPLWQALHPETLKAHDPSPRVMLRARRGTTAPHATLDALIQALSNQDLVRVKALVRQRPGLIREHDARNRTVLALVPGRRLDILRFLLAKGADPNGEGGRPLRMAIRSRDAELLRYVLSKRADPNLTDSLSVAAAVRASLEVVKILVESGADVNRVSNGETPVVAFTRADLPDVVEYLRSRGGR
jgi:hypothetical protein